MASEIRLFVAKDGYLRDPQTREYVYQRDGGVCGICGEEADHSNWDADHKVPLSKGGPAVLENFQVSHPTCNKKKLNKM